MARSRVAMAATGTAAARPAPSDAAPPDAAPPPTRERILFEAAELFARHGFHATTTRQIAQAVGVRQPSLFHHFASKDAIAEALLEWDLGRALPAARVIAAIEAPAAVRLYRYLRDDVRHLATAPYNLTGMYTDELLGRPEFGRWAELQDELHDIIERLIAIGIELGEFVEVHTGLVRHMITGILVRTITVHSGGRSDGEELGDAVARLIVRGLLRDQSTLDEVAGRAAALR